jgi:hypothetical protein
MPPIVLDLVVSNDRDYVDDVLVRELHDLCLGEKQLRQRRRRRVQV